MHSEYVTPIALPLQQWLHERASMLRYTYLPVFLCIIFDSRACKRQIQTKLTSNHNVNIAVCGFTQFIRISYEIA